MCYLKHLFGLFLISHNLSYMAQDCEEWASPMISDVVLGCGYGGCGVIRPLNLLRDKPCSSPNSHVEALIPST